MSSGSNTTPDFIGIGAQRSGTTWVANVMSLHPEIWVPPLKELHYFDSVSVEHYSFKYRYQRHGWNSFRSITKIPTLQNILWHFKYHSLPYSDKWYKDLFADAKKRGKVCGEITPAYAILSRDDIQRIRQKYGNIKIVYILRNPIERAWSQLVRILGRQQGRDVRKISVNEFIRVVEDSNTISDKSCHYRVLDNWERYFSAELIHYISFDDLVESPGPVFSELFRFLGVDVDLSLELPEPANAAANGLPMPSALRHSLYLRFESDMRSLINHPRVGIFAQRWLDAYQ